MVLTHWTLLCHQIFVLFSLLYSLLCHLIPICFSLLDSLLCHHISVLFSLIYFQFSYSKLCHLYGQQDDQSMSCSIIFFINYQILSCSCRYNGTPRLVCLQVQTSTSSAVIPLVCHTLMEVATSTITLMEQRSVHPCSLWFNYFLGSPLSVSLSLSLSHFVFMSIYSLSLYH